MSHQKNKLDNSRRAFRLWPYMLGFLLVNLLLLICHEIGVIDALCWAGADTFSTDPVMLVSDWGIFNFDYGTSPLWSILLIPFAWLNLPLNVANVLSLFIMAVATWLFLRQISEYTRGKKRVALILIVLLSAGFLYYNATLSSGMALGVLALAIMLGVYKNRMEKPAFYATSLILMCLANTYSVGLALILSVGWMVERIKNRKKQRRLGREIMQRNSGIWSVVALVVTVAIFSVTLIQLVGDFKLDWEAINDFLLDFNEKLFGITLPILELILIFTLLMFLVKYPKLFIYEFLGLGCYLVILYVENSNIGQLVCGATMLIVVLVSLYIILQTEEPCRTPKWLRKSELVGLLDKRGVVEAFLLVPVALSVPATVIASGYEVTQRYDYVADMANYLNGLPKEAEIAIIGISTPILVTALIPLLDDNHFVTTYSNDTFLDGVKNDEEAENNTEEWRLYPESHGFYVLKEVGNCSDDNALTMPEDWEMLERFDKLAVYHQKLGL